MSSNTAKYRYRENFILSILNSHVTCYLGYTGEAKDKCHVALEHGGQNLYTDGTIIEDVRKQTET